MVYDILPLDVCASDNLNLALRLCSAILFRSSLRWPGIFVASPSSYIYRLHVIHVE